jgi:hypothetical protein
LGETWARYGGDVQLFFIDVSSMLCKVNPLSEYVGGFVHPVGVDGIVRHCIWHQPHTLLLLFVVWCVTKLKLTPTMLPLPQSLLMVVNVVD